MIEKSLWHNSYSGIPLSLLKAHERIKENSGDDWKEIINLLLHYPANDIVTLSAEEEAYNSIINFLKSEVSGLTYWKDIGRQINELENQLKASLQDNNNSNEINELIQTVANTKKDELCLILKYFYGCLHNLAILNTNKLYIKAWEYAQGTINDMHQLANDKSTIEVMYVTKITQRTNEYGDNITNSSGITLELDGVTFNYFKYLLFQICYNISINFSNELRKQNSPTGAITNVLKFSEDCLSISNRIS